MPFYLQMSKNITQQRDIYDTIIFRFLQIFYGLTLVYGLPRTPTVFYGLLRSLVFYGLTLLF